MNKTIDDLREHLFETLAALKDKEHPMDIDRAKTIAGVAQVIVNSAKVEVELVREVGGKGSGFIPERATGPGLPDGTPRTTVHRLK